MKRGERSPEAVRDYRRLQRHKRRYMELREELQLAGVIPTEPDGAIHDERVDPADQTAQALPALTAQAIRSGWAVPEDKKPGLVDEMVSIVDDPDESTKVKVAAFNALRQADQSQWEREHPKDDKASVGPVVVNVNVVSVDNAEVGASAPTVVLPQGGGGAGNLLEVAGGDGDKQDGAGLSEAAPVPDE